MDWSPPGFSVHGVFQARILDWIARPSSRGSSWPRDRTQVSCIAGGLFTIWAAWEAWWTCRPGANNHFLEDYSEDEITGENALCLAHRAEPAQAPSSPLAAPSSMLKINPSAVTNTSFLPPLPLPPIIPLPWLSQQHALCGVCVCAREDVCAWTYACVWKLVCTHTSVHASTTDPREAAESWTQILST